MYESVKATEGCESGKVFTAIYGSPRRRTFSRFSKPNTLARVFGFCRGAGRFNGEGNFVSCVSYVVSYFVYVPQGDIGSVHRAELMTHLGGG